MPVSTPGGANTHSSKASAVTAMVAQPSRGLGETFRPGVALAVKLGTTRPAITVSIITIRPSAACSGDSGEISTTPSMLR